MKTNILPKILIVLLTLTSFLTVNAANYKFQEFSLDRKSWEDCNVVFNIMNTVSGYSRIEPLEYKIDVLQEDGTIIKSIKNKTTFLMDDKNLGSGEKIIIRLTAYLVGEEISSEKIVFASQKSVIIDNDVNLPIENHISVGDVKIACKLMRKKFNNETKWETIGTFDDVAVSLFISNSKASDYVEVPLNKKVTSFDLAQYKYFDDFKMQMERDLRKTNVAQIKYYFQFVWDRNVYIVEGGSKNINMQNQEDIAVVKSYTTDIQKLVTANSYDRSSQISASAE